MTRSLRQARVGSRNQALIHHAAQARHRSCSAGGRLPTAQAYAEAPAIAETDVFGDRSFAGAQAQVVGSLTKNPTMSGVFC